MAFALTSCGPSPVCRLDGDRPSLSVQKLSLTSPAGDNVTRWAALGDPCLEQVTELQPAPHVG